MDKSWSRNKNIGDMESKKTEKNTTRPKGKMYSSRRSSQETPTTTGGSPLTLNLNNLISPLSSSSRNGGNGRSRSKPVGITTARPSSSRGGETSRTTSKGGTYNYSHPKVSPHESQGPEHEINFAKGSLSTRNSTTNPPHFPIYSRDRDRANILKLVPQSPREAGQIITYQNQLPDELAASTNIISHESTNANKLSSGILYIYIYIIYREYK